MAVNGKREAAALALAIGKNVKAAARASHVGERTLHRWLGDEDFQRRVTQVRAELFGCAVGKLARLAGKAADALAKLLRSESDSVRLQAARTILESGNRLREAVEVEQRLAAVEERLARRGGKP
jgi:transposase-like protein